MQHLFSKLFIFIFLLISSYNASRNPLLYFYGFTPYFIGCLIIFYWTLSIHLPKGREIDIVLVFGTIFMSGDLLRVDRIIYYFILVYLACKPNLLLNLAIVQSMMLILDRVFVGRLFILFLIFTSFLRPIVKGL